MRVIVADDEELILEDTIHQLEQVPVIQEIHGFQSGEDVLAYMETHLADVAFLDIQMRGMDGIALAKKLKVRYPKLNLIFLTAYNEYMKEAFRLHASGYLLKPPLKEDIQHELEELRHPIKRLSKKEIHVQCFGNFEIYINDEPIVFRYGKTKELLAYLVDRKGSLCSNREIASVLWEDCRIDETKASYFRNLVADMKKTLHKLDCEDLIEKKRGMLALRKEKVDCDYYNWLEGDPTAVLLYEGEYMCQYSWAEKTHGEMEREL